MPHLLCLFVTLIIGIVILALLYWVFNMALGLLPEPAPSPKVILAVRVLVALVVVIVIIYWLISGMPCLFRIAG